MKVICVYVYHIYRGKCRVNFHQNSKHQQQQQSTKHGQFVHFIEQFHYKIRATIIFVVYTLLNRQFCLIINNRNIGFFLVLYKSIYIYIYRFLCFTPSPPLQSSDIVECYSFIIYECNNNNYNNYNIQMHTYIEIIVMIYISIYIKKSFVNY